MCVRACVLVLRIASVYRARETNMTWIKRRPHSSMCPRASKNPEPVLGPPCRNPCLSSSSSSPPARPKLLRDPLVLWILRQNSSYLGRLFRPAASHIRQVSSPLRDSGTLLPLAKLGGDSTCPTCACMCLPACDTSCSRAMRAGLNRRGSHRSRHGGRLRSLAAH